MMYGHNQQIYKLLPFAGLNANLPTFGNPQITLNPIGCHFYNLAPEDIDRPVNMPVKYHN